MWKILRGACATEENYRKKGFHTVSKCYLCGNGHDIMDHIVWHCDFSEKIWHWLGGIFKFLNPRNFMDVLECVKKVSPAVREVWFISAFTTMVKLWFTRNRVCYDEEDPNLLSFKMKILQFTKECSVRMKGKIRGTVYDMNIMSEFGIKGMKVQITEVKECIFRFLAVNQVLICCDGASKGNPGNSGYGFVGRSCTGGFLGAVARGLGVATNFNAEVMALIGAGECPIRRQFLNVCFSLDSMAVLQALQDGIVGGATGIGGL
ncbi:uncharacterized protein LOC113272660 [Papaver somniferum]|uniref:uncharacterized protein LOC113272660 n=1 Tax=Papaver somniferum TaxID=3469 RepID=UPI000E704FCF|nr:uncharacterized protein LOC113272660 [Papaver somniferum]